MSRQIPIAALVLAGMLAGTMPSLAQFEGNWQCEMTYTELNQQGQRTSGYVKQYVMGVYPGGGMEAQGAYVGIGGQTQFQVQGQWKVDQGHFMAQAQGMQQSQFGTMPEMLIMLAQPGADGRTMSYNYEQRDPSGSYVMNRQLYACQRM
ncbi:hypothetical protein DEVEQU_03737 [Devosia equisanguinis]|uniref:DUF1579 domain-containing protein n=1 Tax=Devosia equisanguinis TaxID=2490941 RepID=A0A447IGH0_9HYPH|nr:hypothetical protein [Devosia equisanguinis]VDS06573.1 hypothetical protein DEVEQU_03737 [Devosia equisanguinis]